MKIMSGVQEIDDQEIEYLSTDFHEIEGIFLKSKIQTKEGSLWIEGGDLRIWRLPPRKSEVRSPEGGLPGALLKRVATQNSLRTPD